MSIATNTFTVAQDTCPLFASYKSSISHSIYTNILLHRSKEKPILFKFLKNTESMYSDRKLSSNKKKVKFTRQGSDI